MNRGSTDTVAVESGPLPSTGDPESHIVGGPGERAGDGERRSDPPQFLVRAAGWSWRLLVVGAAILFVGWVVIQVRVVVIPAFVALLIAALLTPAVELLDRRMPRLLATWITLLAAVGLLGLLGWLLQAPIRDALDDLAASWDATVTDIESWLRTGPLSLTQERIDSLHDRVAGAGDGLLSGLADSPASTTRRAVDVIGGFFLAIVLTFFFLKDGPQMWTWGVRRVRPVRRQSVDVGGQAAFRALQGWIRGVAITGVADAALIGAALIILGVPAAVPLIVLTFFGAFFPIVGATVAGALATLIALTTQGPRTAVIVAVVVLVVQQVEGDVLLPVVMKRQVSLHPAVVLLVLALGGALGGIVGALIAVPMTAAGAAATRAVRNLSGECADDAAGDQPASEEQPARPPDC